MEQEKKNASTFSWFSVGGGRLTVGPRPKFKAIQGFPSQGVTHLLTLLSESEGAKDLEKHARLAGVEWLWLPFKNGDPPSKDRLPEIVAFYQKLSGVLSLGGSVLVHCAAGIHRTGMITFGFLRFLGLSSEEAKAALFVMRKETGEGVGELRTTWGEQLYKYRDIKETSLPGSATSLRDE